MSDEMTSPDFKLADPSDIEVIVPMMAEFYAVDNMSFNEEVARRALATLLQDTSKGNVWLIENNNRIVGYLAVTFCFSLEFDGTAAVVDELYVKANHRGQGIGTRTLQFLEGVLGSMGIRTLHLEVDQSNVVAQSLYKKAGFQDRNNFYLSKWIS
jgi:ribosomal protein S18 acetylase RimI-like enzyme